MPSPILPTQTGDKQFDKLTALTHSVMDALEGVTAERDRLRAENVRLREALTNIAQGNIPPSMPLDVSKEEFRVAFSSWMQQTARAALAKAGA